MKQKGIKIEGNIVEENETNLVHPEANRAPHSMSTPPINAVCNVGPLDVARVSDDTEAISAPNMAPQT